MKYIILIFLIPIIILSQTNKELAAQAQRKQAVNDLNQRVTGELGFSDLEGDMYVRFTLGYEFSFNKIGIGVQLPLNILVNCRDKNGCDDKTWYRIKKNDWDEFSDWLKIVRYIRYGHKFDESNMFYARFGDLGVSYIGHSTIVGDYLNTISWNSFKPGIQFDVYTPWGGIETITDDIASPHLLGTRLFVRPLTFVFGEESYFSNFAVGLSLIGDIDAKSPSKTKNAPNTPEKDIVYQDETVFFYGFDLEFRIFKNEYITVTPYTDYNFLAKHGYGLHFGIDTRLHIPLTGAYFRLRPEFRVLGDEYLPTYFDTLYTVNRKKKYDLLMAQKRKNGYYIEVGYDQYLLNSLLFNIKATYEDYEGKDNSTLLIFGSVPILEFFNFSAIYTKTNFDKFTNAFDLEDALLILEASVKIYGPLKLRAQYERTWYENKDGVLEHDSSWNFSLFMGFNF